MKNRLAAWLMAFVLCAGLLTRAGQSAVCLPNRVIVRLTGAAAPEVDAVIR